MARCGGLEVAVRPEKGLRGASIRYSNDSKSTIEEETELLKCFTRIQKIIERSDKLQTTGYQAIAIGRSDLEEKWKLKKQANILSPFNRHKVVS